MKQDDFLNKIEDIKTFLKDELAKLRVGKASSALIEDIEVSAYEGASALPVNELASISLPEPQTILVEPWDKSILAKIEDAIVKSDRGLSPINDGDHIRINVPELTEERRKMLAKDVSALVEQAKIRLRTLRRDAIKSIEEQEDNKVIPEDEMFRLKKEIDEIVASTNKLLENMGKFKSEEILKV